MKNLSFFLAFLILFPSCYTYRQVKLEEEYSLNVEDRITVTTIDKEYDKVLITDLSDSSFWITWDLKYRDGSKKSPSKMDNTHEINNADIRTLYIAKKDKTKTVLLIVVPILTLGVVGLLTLDSDCNYYTNSNGRFKCN